MTIYEDCNKYLHKPLGSLSKTEGPQVSPK
jgi:hypothetical protein